jgi:hypothetical protein
MKKLINSNIRVSLNTNHIRLALGLLSLVAMVLGGSAAGHWD